jgi:hypothetical protein
MQRSRKNHEIDENNVRIKIMFATSCSLLLEDRYRKENPPEWLKHLPHIEGSENITEWLKHVPHIEGSEQPVLTPYP